MREELAERLLAPDDDRDAWRAYRALDAEEREHLVELLKAELDRRVRSSPPAAIPAAEVLLRAAGDAPRKLPLALRGRAAALHMNGRGAEALPDYERAARLYAEAGEDVERGRVLRSMVDVLHLVGRTDEALSAAEEARTIFAAHDERLLIAQLDVNLGNVHLRRGEPRLAGDCYRAAHASFEALGDEVGRAYAAFSLAILARDAGALTEAAELYREARAVWKAKGLDVHVADCDSSLAVIDARGGRYREAVLGLERARAAYAGGSRPAGVPECDFELAELHFRLDACHDALACAARAAQGFERIGYRLEVARATELLGVARRRLGDRAGALADLARAEAIFRELGNELRLAALAIHRGTLLVEQGEAASALAELEGACERLRDAEYHLLADLAEVAYVQALAAAGRGDEARARVGELLDSPRRSSFDALVRVEALRAQAELERAAGRADAERNCLRVASAAVAESYARVPGTDARIAFFGRRQEPFLLLAWSLLDGRPRESAVLEAIGLIEAARGRSLGERRIATEEPTARAARERLGWLLARRLDRELDGGESDGHEELLRTERELLRAERQSSRAVQAPGATGEPARGDVDRLLAGRAEGETLLAYLVCRRGARALLIDDGGARVIELNYDAARLRALRDRLGLQLAKHRLGSGYAERHRASLLASLDRLSAELGELLLAPLAGALGPGPVVVVPHGDLHGLPFHALRFEGRPLLAEREVSYAPSLATLALCRERGPAPAGVLATAVSDARAPRIAGEVELLRRLYPDGMRALTGTELVAALPDCTAGLLHVGAHGSFRLDHPLFSGVDLDGAFLTAYDLRPLRLDLGLVVLSGCDTGVQARLPGDELVGLERAFFEAGARSVLGSLWPVLDEPAAELMERFYAQIARGVHARAALASAQRALLADGAPLSDWAAFALAGEPHIVCRSA
ncbi:MAG: CHAT domain-containing tetratricopeptide repeat protein [Planctomycetota bacterium]